MTFAHGAAAITLALVAVIAGCGASSQGVRVAGNRSGAGSKGLRVAGNRLLDGNGKVVIFRGVNRSGTEYACVRGASIFAGPSNAASVQAMASWHINFVRVTLNEDCWLGIGGVNPALGGEAYRRAIVSYVQLLHRYGMHVELSLVWAAPASDTAYYQPAAPDEDHAPAMWHSLAGAFKSDPDVILAPWGEPVIDARCFVAGGVCATFGARHILYRTAGMQQAVNVMRAAGYHGVIAIPGVDFANDLSRWLADEPRDPLHELIAEAHVYPNGSCHTVACLNRTMAPVAQRVPLIFGEYGPAGPACGTGDLAMLLRWADAHHVGYAAWAWEVWSNCLGLISSYDGTPANSYGAFVKSYYASAAGKGTP